MEKQGDGWFLSVLFTAWAAVRLMYDGRQLCSWQTKLLVADGKLFVVAGRAVRGLAVDRAGP